MIVIKKYWPHAVALVLLIVILLFIFRKVPLPGESDATYDHLQIQNDSLLQQNELSRWRQQDLQITIDSLRSVIDNTDERIKKIYINVEKKVAVYDTFTVEQLERFFSKRYGTRGKD